MPSAAEAAPSFLYVPTLATLGESFTLSGEDARYLAKVVRARDGERLTATDGAGHVATLLVRRARPEPLLAVESRHQVPAPTPARLLCGAPEGERGDWLVEKSAELGVTDLVPVDTRRGSWPSPERRERWERLAVAALRQSRSAWLMRVATAADLAVAVAGLESGVRWLADPGGARAESLAWRGGESITGAIGPSSGFSDEERKLLHSCGFISVMLAGSRLRTETAALAMAAGWAARRAGPPTPERAGEA